jgi:dipeptidyl aminopeptidase/acylaminoacyl peptidase
MQPFESGQFDISIPVPEKDKEPKIDILVNVKDKWLNYAFHTRRQVYLTSVRTEWKTVSLSGSYPYEGYQFALTDFSEATDEPALLTSGDQGAVSECKFSPDGSQVAWLEMQEDGNESDRNQVVVYDLEARKKSIWTESWDRSPSSVTVSVFVLGLSIALY